jgi:CRP/FNR family cyclic AMP-dependent transcriptional regulator
MVDPGASTAAERDELVVPKGTAVFRQGDPGDSMFIIEAGRVRIVIHCEGQETAVAVLEAGDFFGELSLLSNAARTATAEALEDTTLLVVRRDVFAMMMQDDLEIVFRMLHAMGDRLGHTDRQFWNLMQRQGRIRLLAEGLGRTGATLAQTPVVLEVERLAADLRLDAPTVRTMVGELAERGAGTLEDGRWRLDGPEHVRAVVALLRAYAEGGAT